MAKKLNFEEFQRFVEENISSLLPEQYENVEVTLLTVKKNNGALFRAVRFKKKNSNIATNLYLEKPFHEYENGSNLLIIMQQMAKEIVKGLEKSKEYETIARDMFNFDFVKDKIIMVAVNAEKNRELLTKVPHKRRLDLAIIYKVCLKCDKGVETIHIKNEYLEKWGVTMEEIHKLAIKNTQRLFPVMIMNSAVILKEKLLSNTDDECLIQLLLQMIEKTPKIQQMYVVTNEQKTNGAGCIFYDGVLDDLAAKIGTDLYVFPSSIHECMVISVNIGTPDMCDRIIKDVNRNGVSEMELLSDNAYFYDAKQKTLNIAHNMPFDLKGIK